MILITNKLQTDVVIFTTNTSLILEGQNQPGMVINAGLTYWHNTCFQYMVTGRRPVTMLCIALKRHCTMVRNGQENFDMVPRDRACARACVRAVSSGC